MSQDENQKELTLTGEFSLHDDEYVREELTAMSKWEAIIDDERNEQEQDWEKIISGMMQLGRKYRITLKVEDIGPA